MGSYGVRHALVLCVQCLHFDQRQCGGSRPVRAVWAALPRWSPLPLLLLPPPPPPLLLLLLPVRVLVLPVPFDAQVRRRRGPFVRPGCGGESGRVVKAATRERACGGARRHGAEVGGGIWGRERASEAAGMEGEEKRASVR